MSESCYPWTFFGVEDSRSQKVLVGGAVSIMNRAGWGLVTY